MIRRDLHYFAVDGDVQQFIDGVVGQVGDFVVAVFAGFGVLSVDLVAEFDLLGEDETTQNIVQSFNSTYNGLMTEPLLNPHDRFFKDLFSRQEAAQDFLQHYLPAELATLLDLSTLHISKDSFIDAELQEHFSDLLYQVNLHSGQEACIYLLFEHKSYPDPLIALQLLRYMVRIWEQSLKQQRSLLPIVPLVIYHGQKKWRVGLEFTALFDVPTEMKPYVPAYQYWLCDLSQYSDEQIKGQVILQVGLRLLKYIWYDDMPERLDDILGLLRTLGQQQTGLEYLQTTLRYIAGATDKVSEEQLKQVVLELFSEGEQLMPTLVEQWLERGREEGREQGREAALTVLRRFLAMRFGVELSHFDPAFAPLDLTAITRLSDAAFEVTTLTEFEALLAELPADQTNETK